MKTWEIYHYIYEDICNDSYYGKEHKHITIGFVTDTEDNVKLVIDKLNENNHSYYAQQESEDEHLKEDPASNTDYFDLDFDCLDENYFAYRELQISTIAEIEKRLIKTNK